MFSVERARLGTAAGGSSVRVAPGRRRRRLVVVAAVALVGRRDRLCVRRARLLLDKGFVGLPPVGATPSTPESGELEMYLPATAVRSPRIGFTPTGG